MGVPGTPLLRFNLILLAATLATLQPLCAQAPPAPSTSAGGSYFVAYRTPGHVTVRRPEDFHGVADDILAFLNSNHVLLVSDPERPSFQTSELFSLESLLKLARDAGASHLLYLTVGRSGTKWVILTLQCFDLSGKLLWEEITDGGSWAFSGKTADQKALEKMKKKLERHVGGAGLPVKTPSPSPAGTQEKAKTVAHNSALDWGRERKRCP